MQDILAALVDLEGQVVVETVAILDHLETQASQDSMVLVVHRVNQDQL